MRLFAGRGAVANAEVAAVRAAAGAVYLDARFGPRWDQVIDLERLDIGSFHCILGQLGWAGMGCFPSPWRAVECGFSCGLLADFLVLFYRTRAAASSYGLLTEAWKELITERRQQREERAMPAEGV